MGYSHLGLKMSLGDGAQIFLSVMMLLWHIQVKIIMYSLPAQDFRWFMMWLHENRFRKYCMCGQEVAVFCKILQRFILMETRLKWPNDGTKTQTFHLKIISAFLDYDTVMSNRK